MFMQWLFIEQKCLDYEAVSGSTFAPLSDLESSLGKEWLMRKHRQPQAPFQVSENILLSWFLAFFIIIAAVQYCRSDAKFQCYVLDPH